MAKMKAEVFIYGKDETAHNPVFGPEDIERHLRGVIGDLGGKVDRIEDVGVGLRKMSARIPLAQEALLPLKILPDVWTKRFTN